MAKRENDGFSIKHLIELFIKENNLKHGFQKIHIQQAWNTVMGKDVASYTYQIKLENNVLFVWLKSSVLREELILQGKDKIIALLNKEMEEVVVKRLMLF
ncbi:MAG: DUF721 domain-containing protein [Tenacibaculum sp.]